MIIYHTTFHVDENILVETLKYFKQHFIPSSMRSGILSRPRMQRVLGNEEEGVSLSIQFYVEDEETLHQWLQEEGVRIQQNLVHKFGNRVAGFSTLLEEIDFFNE